MKVEFNSTEQVFNIETGTLDKYSRHDAGFRVEVIARKHDLAEVEKALVEALTIFRSLRALSVSEVVTGPALAEADVA